jgi:hypothetical protein
LSRRDSCASAQRKTARKDNATSPITGKRDANARKYAGNDRFQASRLSTSFKTIHFVTAMPGSFPHNALTHPLSGRGAPVKMAMQIHAE